MLQSFRGTFDQTGLRALRREDGADASLKGDAQAPGIIPFWVILDSSELPRIYQAISLGARDVALEILFQCAKSAGADRS